jgi:DHA1 family bicyclomycin/chloramphenicol resistance-like MFS transporter
MGKRLSLGEFVALIAFLFALIALGTDTMLPALGLIALDFQLSDANQAQLIVTIFILGTGLGQLLAGPLSDAYGRKVILGAGILIFFVASLVSVITTDFTMLLITRFVQGLGISAPRSVGLAMVRDIYKGRQMARVMSLAMMIFVVAPAVAPLIGQFIMLAFDWRIIFVFFMAASLICYLWLMLRQEETHTVENRRPFSFGTLKTGYIEVFTNKRVMISMLAVSMVYAALFSYLSMAQQNFSIWLDAEARFPLYFGITAIFGATSNALNARFVERLGMWYISTLALSANLVMAVVFAFSLWLNIIPDQWLLIAFVTWSGFFFFFNVMCFGNLNALAMEPVGHIAGLAASIIGSTSTTICVLMAIPVGMMFAGTGMPLILATAIFCTISLILNLFNPRNVD